jgi:FAD/FMN-containing dehydrogenase/Fe-S oxidoreductase
MPDLVAALRRAGVAEVSASSLDRALYSSDASLYRVVPQVVVRPRSIDEILATLEVARSLAVPLTMRGAGTSIAGNAVGPGIVVDTRKHLDRVLSIDAEARTARVEPGVVHATLQRAVAPHKLRFGPDPSTHSRCTIGGMIGNNACGSRALGYGRTADNVAGMTVAFGNGAVVDTAAGGDQAGRLFAMVDKDLAHVRTEFGRFCRQVSGYSLEHLLPEHRRLDRFLVGSEGTLAVVLDATVELVAEPEVRTLVVLGFEDIVAAADAVPSLLAMGNADATLVALEGFDSRLVDALPEARRPRQAIGPGNAWLIAELAGRQADAVRELTARIVAADVALATRIVEDEREQAAIWRIREEGAGLAARSLDRPAYSGWEDAAVPPEHLGAWLRDFDALLAAHGLRGVPYGHFGEGCVHARIDFTFDDGGARFRAFLGEAAVALRKYGGSLSGEHGDGRARSELLPLMYDERSLALFRAAKAICDPDNVLNPGVLVDPLPIAENLRPARPVAPIPRVLGTGTLGEDVHRCTGVGKCVADTTAGVMCPSYLATRDEKDSTRGRARVLQEALDGSLIAGLADPAVHEALDFCLSCKGCASDCPTGVDMAAYKSETLHHVYAGRLRPRSHYTLGRLPQWSRRVSPGVANRLLAWRATARLAKALAGVDPRRSLPALSAESLQSRSATAEAPDVWLWADSFTDRFASEQGVAAIRVLEQAGLRVGVIPEDACCGLTWITTGQLDQARRIMQGTVAALHPYVASGVPVIGLEPSCLATLRSEAPEVGAGMRTLAEFLTTLEGWTPPDLTGIEIVAQPHCHHASVLGWEADEALLKRAGATVTRVGGCCGLAGNFGMEKGHYEISVAVAETALLPAVRAAGEGAVVLADGLSCRHQLADLAGVRAVHLAELFAR